MDLDTGACTSIISEAKYHNNFSHIKLKPYFKHLFTVSGESLQVQGQIEVDVEYKE